MTPRGLKIWKKDGLIFLTGYEGRNEKMTKDRGELVKKPDFEMT